MLWIYQTYKAVYINIVIHIFCNGDKAVIIILSVGDVLIYYVMGISNI